MEIIKNYQKLFNKTKNPANLLLRFGNLDGLNCPYSEVTNNKTLYDFIYNDKIFFNLIVTYYKEFKNILKAEIINIKEVE